MESARLVLLNVPFRAPEPLKDSVPNPAVPEKKSGREPISPQFAVWIIEAGSGRPPGGIGWNCSQRGAETRPLLCPAR
jgi:hypothetical protein